MIGSTFYQGIYMAFRSASDAGVPPSRRHALQAMAGGFGVSLLASCQRTAAPTAQVVDAEAKAMKKRPTVVAFDVVETLFSLEPLRPRLQAVGLPAHSLDAWYTRLIRDGMALDATGVYKPFRDVARAALEGLLAEHGQPIQTAQVDGVMAGFAELPAFPDVKPAFQRLRAAKVRVVLLTNGNADLTRKLLDRNELADLVERVISIDEVQHWKPNRAVYTYALKVIDVAPERLAMTAVHSWDLQGAAQAGLTTAWVSRREKRFHPLMTPPDVSGETLVDTCTGLLALRPEYF
jgi:2-haloacid dehalogenase